VSTPRADGAEPRGAPSHRGGGRCAPPPPRGGHHGGMNMISHAGPGPQADALPPPPEPSYAERARTLVHLARSGALSTLYRRQPGYPFGSVMPYAPDDRGAPLLLISSMAMHTQNLEADPRARLLVTQP